VGDLAVARVVKPNRICFVAAPIGDAGSDTRKRSDRVLEIIERVVEKHGYKAIRADRMPGPGLVTRQMVRHLLDAPLVIADLTGGNPNVYYELGLRHAVGKPYIQVIAKGEKPPFDLGDTRTLSIDHDEPYQAEAILATALVEVERPGFEVENPVTAVRHLQ
jgi:hypothetical protein